MNQGGLPAGLKTCKGNVYVNPGHLHVPLLQGKGDGVRSGEDGIV